MSSSSSTPVTPSRSGITTDGSGQRLVASSTRPDGSKRKEIKIRPGYRPPEDVEVYKNRTAEAWKTRGSGGVPGATVVETDGGPSSAASNKNAKRREARKKAKAAENAQAKEGETEASEVTGKVVADKAQADKVQENGQGTESSAPQVDPEAEKEKKVKRLKKRLREARELKEKKESGQGLLQEQFEKVIKINELMRDLEKLGVKDEEEGQVAA